MTTTNEYVEKIDKIEPELRTPTPRKVRRRPLRFPQAEMLPLAAPILSKVRPYLMVVFLIPVLWGIYFLTSLIKVVFEVISSRSGGSPKPIIDILPLLVINLVWNFIVLTGLWHVLVKPLIYCRLVMYGQPAVGRITGVTVGQRTCWVSYLFYPEKGFGGLIGSAEVASNEWEKTGELGAEITVLFFQSRPKWNVPYRFSGYEVISGA
jgi:hypothetical protein